MKTLLLTVTVALAGAFPIVATSAQSASLAGNWLQQSRGKELILLPKIKLQPNVGMGTGTSLGGSVGYGSMTRTAVVTEPTVLDVQRSMRLNIAADGNFTWSSTIEHADGGNCIRTTRREKHGRATLESATLTFAVAGGNETFENSCGKRGTSAIGPITERYSVSSSRDQIQLTDGATRWVFKRG